MIFNLLWPEVCPFCGKLYQKGICPACKEKLKYLRIVQPVCMKCGKPVRNPEQEYCSDCNNTNHYFERGRAIWLHKNPVSYSIYQFKYHNQRVFAKYYAEEMYRRFEKLICEWNPEIIIPIPLHKKKKRIRGYNQAFVLANELSRRVRIPVRKDILVRTKYTNPQKNLDHTTRKKNMSNAFKVLKSVKGMRSILLIDDIYTTGNTIDEAAKRLKESGAENVYFLTVSIGQGY